MKKLILLLLLFVTTTIIAQKEYSMQLIPFDYDSTVLSKENKLILDNIVNVHMNGEKLIIVIKVTDKDDYHRQLAKKRVLSIIKHLNWLDMTQDKQMIIVTYKLETKKKGIKIYIRK